MTLIFINLSMILKIKLKPKMIILAVFFSHQKSNLAFSLIISKEMIELFLFLVNLLKCGTKIEIPDTIEINKKLSQFSIYISRIFFPFDSPFVRQSYCFFSFSLHPRKEEKEQYKSLHFLINLRRRCCNITW